MIKNATEYKILKLLIATVMMSSLLTGCLYPQSDSSPADIVSKEAIRNVQGAVDQYLEEKSILPMHNSDASVDRFEKFRVNFEVLKNERYLEMLPRSAFEGGGNYYFLILNEDSDPVIKAQSIYLSQQINDLQRKVTDYQSKNDALPLGDQLYDGFYALDYSALSMKTPKLHSVYSGSIVQLMVSEGGTVYIDYASDIYQAKLAHPELEVPDNFDWREVLILDSDYVPVKSTKYTMVNDQPIPYE